jgi:hypothetical protein
VIRFADAYTLRARLFPAVIATAPALALLATFVSWRSFAPSQALVTLAIGVLLFVFGDFARRRGKRAEVHINARMGGLPSITMLRYRDGTFEEAAKARYREWLGGKIGATPPSTTEEERNPESADKFYERCGAWLRENTRDKKKFGILFEENITYGFRRNLYGLKVPALALNALVVSICAAALFFRTPVGPLQQVATSAWGILTLAAVHAVYIALAVTEESVREASRQYARQLILCCENMMDTKPRIRRSKKQLPDA